jgi:hypothetical protein
LTSAEQWLDANTIACQRFASRLSPEACRRYASEKPEACLGCDRRSIGTDEAAQSCTVDDCDRPYYAKGFCSVHYSRQRYATGVRKPARGCSVAGCSEKHYGKGLCRAHYSLASKAKKQAQPREAKLCSVGGCGKKHAAKGLCKAHYQRQLMHPRQAELRRSNRLTITFANTAVPLLARLQKAAKANGNSAEDEALIYIEACLNYQEGQR